MRESQTPESAQRDWSHVVQPLLRPIVKAVPCPTCKARAGMPCRNTNILAAELDPALAEKEIRRRRRPYYQNHVHRTRESAFTEAGYTVPDSPGVKRRELPRATRAAVIKTTGCPKCKAAKGKPCVRQTGYPAGRPHVARIKAYELKHPLQPT